MGDITKAAVWETGKVYIAPLTTAGPTDVTTAWGVDWDECGLLDGDQGFVEAREKETKDFTAWGAGTVLSKNSKHKLTRKFWAYEDNDTVFALVNPGSARAVASGVTHSTVKVPIHSEFAVGFETSDGSKINRKICARASVLDVGDIVESETGMTAREITVVIYADTAGKWYDEYQGAAA